MNTATDTSNADNVIDIQLKKPLNKLAWAWSVKTGKSAAKSVLIALAECADKNTLTAYPSIPHICAMTELDRKTVIASLAWLVNLKLIEDTNQRIGSTRQIPVYKILLGSNPSPETLTELKAKTKKQSNSTENGTVPKTEQYRKRNSTENGTVPDLPTNSTGFTYKQSQKRDTEHLRNTLITPIDISNDISNVDIKKTNKKNKSDPDLRNHAQDVVDLYHKILPELPRILKLDAKRIADINARTKDLRDFSSNWDAYFSSVRDCPLLLGEINSFQASLSWLIKASNFNKVCEGNYRKRQGFSRHTEATKLPSQANPAPLTPWEDM